MFSKAAFSVVKEGCVSDADKSGSKVGDLPVLKEPNDTVFSKAAFSVVKEGSDDPVMLDEPKVKAGEFDLSALAGTPKGANTND